MCRSLHIVEHIGAGWDQWYGRVPLYFNNICAVTAPLRFCPDLEGGRREGGRGSWQRKVSFSDNLTRIKGKGIQFVLTFPPCSKF